MKTIPLTKFCFLLFLGLFVFTACDTVDPTSDVNNDDDVRPPVVHEEQPPPVPPMLPAEIFSLDLSLFDRDPNKLSASGSASPASANFTNFLSAAFRAGAVTVVNTTILTPPAIFTAALAEADAEFITPDIGAPFFQWEMENSELGTLHELRLTAQYNNDDVSVDWALYISGFVDDMGQPTQDFLFLTAKTGLTSAEGDFELFYPIAGSSQKMMEGTYTIDLENDLASVGFAIPDDVNIIGGLATTATTDSTLKILDIETATGAKSVIQWDEASEIGSLTADDYNNGQRACWDTTLRNVDC